LTTTDARIEHDLLGDYEVPNEVYYGVHTARALENFPIIGTPIARYPELIVALACVKLAAARANHRLGLLSTEHADAIATACDEIKSGKLHDQFVVDVIQGGAGTSTNMNANEVIANRGLELLGRRRGDYAYLHPLEHVNLAQSTNDVCPTALKVALQFAVHRLQLAMAELVSAFADKAIEFGGHLKGLPIEGDNPALAGISTNIGAIDNVDAGDGIKETI
jgi:aspartate ammonia-lyase